MAKNLLRENVPLSRFGVLVAQLESIVASASQQSPDPLLSFDLLSDLISSIDEEPKETILLWQRTCEDALYSLLVLGARRPVRHLASLAMARIISKGDTISIYSRASSLQGFLSDAKKNQPLRAAGAAQCLGELYCHFGRRITSGLLETTNIVSKLMRFNEDFVRQEALEMLQNALEGSGGNASSAAYTEAFRIIMRIGVGDKSFIIKIAAAKCLKTLASIGGLGLGIGELESSSSYCIKALEDHIPSVREAFAEALGALLALGMNPEAQVQPKGNRHSTSARKLDGCLQKYLASPFIRASGIRAKEVRIGITLSWVFFLQAIRLKYLHPDSELSDYALQAVDLLGGNSTLDAHALACVLYILRVGVTDQMTESTQSSFLVILGRQLEVPDHSPCMKVAVLRTLSYILTTLGEVPQEFKEILDDTIVATLAHPEQLVRNEAALTLRALAEVDPTCVGGLISYAVTILNALRESISFEKGDNLKVELDSLHGQATVLAALVSISPKLALGYPARLPQSVLDVSKKMLTETNSNPVASTIQKEAGWLLLASLIASMPKEELEDQVFDILSLWASNFNGDTEFKIKQAEDLSEIRVWSAAIDALTAFIRCFICSSTTGFKDGILLPVLMYLGRALSYISALAEKHLSDMKPAVDLFIIKTLIACQSLSDPMTYKSDHPQILQICTTPFRDPSGCEESSCLRLLLDQRDACLGPWIPGRDWFEDELRAFEGGKDGLMPCVWEHELSTFPQPETTNKMLVNQMLLCFGILFAIQDSAGMLSLLGTIDQCVKAGKKQPWHSVSVTNVCVGLLAGFKALLCLRPPPLAVETLSAAQTIFQGILAEGEISAAQRRACSEGLGLLARLGNDIFTARMTQSLLGDLVGARDPSYTGSVALSLGCIHRSAGGMALSTMVPATVSSVSLLAKSPRASLQIWSLHGLLLTIEAAGLSYVSQVQETLLLAMEILLSEESGWIELRQGIGRLINAIVAVLGPELAPGSIFFSRCKSVVAEISSGQETSTLLESVRFTQQLVLFAPQAVSVRSHVQTLLPTLSSRQPTLRHLAVSTLWHLIEKDPVAINQEQIDENLFHMLDKETDTEIGNLVRTTITRLLCTSCPSCPSHWISICRKMILSTSTTRSANSNNRVSEHDTPNDKDGDAQQYFGEDDGNIVSSSKVDVSNRDTYLRYRTRVFAAECLRHVPTAVGKDPAHFDLSLARSLTVNEELTGDWLVLQIQELIAVAYQISTIQFENMQPIGVNLLCTIIDKFKDVEDPDLPGHFLMEQYQAQLVSAIRTALRESSSPFLLEAGLHLATKILMSSIISGNQAAVKRIFSLISRPLNDIEDLYYPSFAEWVECKIKIRLLAAHASVKSYIYAFLRRQHSKIPDEYLGLLPQIAKSSSVLGKYWISILKYYQYTCFRLKPNSKYKSFLDGIQSPLVSSKLQQCLEEAWPVILQAIALDAVPEKPELDESSTPTQEVSTSSLISGYQMVKLEPKEFRFLWGFTLLIMFGRQQPVMGTNTEPLPSPYAKSDEDLMHEETNCPSSLYCETALLVFQSLSEERFFRLGFLTSNICKELLQVFAYSAQLEVPWTSLVVRVLSQIVQVCPNDYFETEGFASMATEICITYLYETLQSCDDTSQDHPECQHLFPPIFLALEKLMHQFEAQLKMTMVLAFTLTSYSCLRVVASESCVSKVIAFVQSIEALLKKHVGDKAKNRDDHLNHLTRVLGVWQTETTSLAKDCMERIHLLENMNTEPSKLMKMKLSFCFQQAFSLAKLTHEAQLLGESHGNYQINCPLYISCTKCIKMVLNDSNMQVQRIGLQILRSMALKELGEGSDAKNQSFFMFFSAELFGDIFSLARKMKKLVTKDSVAITGECLTLLFIFLTLYKVGECQKSLIILFLEVTAMLISSSVDDHSQEETEIRSTALRLVSHLAQISSLAVQFKDVLLALPETRRQQFQDIIRASINQDTDSAETRPHASPLIIKVPVQSKPGSKDTSQVCASESSQLVTDDKESFEEEEDWDAFQSFSAIDDTTAAESVMGNVASGPSSVDNKSVLQDKSSNRDDFCGHSLDDVKEVSDAQHLEGGDKNIILARVEEGNNIKELYDSPPNEGMSMASANHLNEHEETKTSEDQDFQVSAKLQMVEDQEGLRKEKLLGDSEQKIDRCGNGGNFLHASSDPLPLEYQEPGTEEVSCEGSEKLASDLGCTNDIQEGLEKENLPEDSEQKSKCSEIGVDDLHVSSDPLDLKYVLETSNEAEVVSVEDDTMVGDLNHANNVKGLKNEKSIDEHQYKIHIGSEGNIRHASSDTVPLECAQEVGSKVEAAIDGNETSVRDIDFSNNLHEGLGKEKSQKHSDQKLKKSRTVGNDLHASSGPQVLEYYQEPSRETEVAIEGNETLVKDIHFSNDVQKGLEKEKSRKYSEKKLEKSGSGGHDLQISSGLLPLEYDPETNKETEVAIEGCEMLVMDIDIVNDIQEGLEKEKSLKYSEQKMEKRGSGGNDLHASLASVPFEYAQVPDASSGPLPLAYAQESGSETGVAIEGREMLVKDIEFADDIQEGLVKEEAHEYSEQKMEKSGSGSNDLQAPMSPLPLEYAQGSGCEADVATEGRETLVKDIDFANDIQEVLEKEKALEYSVQKMEEGGSRGNNLHAPSGPLPLECAEEQDTKAEISSGGNGELIGDVECKTKTKDARPLECAEKPDTKAKISSGGDGDARPRKKSNQETHGEHDSSAIGNSTTIGKDC